MKTMKTRLLLITTMVFALTSLALAQQGPGGRGGQGGRGDRRGGRGEGGPQAGPRGDGGPRGGGGNGGQQNGPRGGGRGGRGGGRGLAGLGGLALISGPASSALTPEKVARGRELFFDKRLSADQTLACASCHDPNLAFADGRAVARGIGNVEGNRNSPSLVNAGSGRSFFWDGRATTLELQATGPIFNPKELGLAPEDLESRTGMKADDVAAAIASYVRTIRSSESRFDWFQAGQTGVLTEQEKAGLELFRGRANCSNCHGGSNFTDEQFHNTGVAWKDGRFTDDGRFDITRNQRDRGAFKTPTLREIARTAPYMHDGSLATLEDVVDFYDRGGRRNPELSGRIRRLNLSPGEKASLVAFMKTLSGRVSDGL